MSQSGTWVGRGLTGGHFKMLNSWGATYAYLTWLTNTKVGGRVGGRTLH